MIGKSTGLRSALLAAGLLWLMSGALAARGAELTEQSGAGTGKTLEAAVEDACRDAMVKLVDGMVDPGTLKRYEDDFARRIFRRPRYFVREQKIDAQAEADGEFTVTVTVGIDRKRLFNTAKAIVPTLIDGDTNANEFERQMAETQENVTRLQELLTVAPEEFYQWKVVKAPYIDPADNLLYIDVEWGINQSKYTRFIQDLIRIVARMTTHQFDYQEESTGGGLPKRTMTRVNKAVSGDAPGLKLPKSTSTLGPVTREEWASYTLTKNLIDILQEKGMKTRALIITVLDRNGDVAGSNTFRMPKPLINVIYNRTGSLSRISLTDNTSKARTYRFALNLPFEKVRDVSRFSFTYAAPLPDFRGHKYWSGSGSTDTIIRSFEHSTITTSSSKITAIH